MTSFKTIEESKLTAEQETKEEVEKPEEQDTGTSTSSKYKITKYVKMYLCKIKTTISSKKKGVANQYVKIPPKESNLCKPCIT